MLCAGEFVARLKDPSCTVVVSISGQSVASLAVAHNLSQVAAARKLAAFFRRLGVAAVLDVSPGRDMALMEAASEFVQRYKDTREQRNTLGEFVTDIPSPSPPVVQHMLPPMRARLGEIPAFPIPQVSSFTAYGWVKQRRHLIANC